MQIKGLIWALGLALALSPETFADTILFSEDFESYAVGSNLIGQGGWLSSVGTNPLLINNTGPLPTKVLDGFSITGGDQNVAHHTVPGGLPMATQTTLSFHALAIAGSHNSWTGLADASGLLQLAVIWTYSIFGGPGWTFEVRQNASGGPFLNFLTGGGTGVPAEFTIVFDRLANEVWGTYDFGGGPLTTPILPSSQRPLPASIMSISVRTFAEQGAYRLTTSWFPPLFPSRPPCCCWAPGWQESWLIFAGRNSGRRTSVRVN